MTSSTISVGLAGARGHVGAELVTLLDAHPRVKLAWAAGRSNAGTKIGSATLEELSPEHAAAKKSDVVFLALPNGQAAHWIAAIENARPDAVIIDLSADMRFTDTWVYGLPELNRAKIKGATRISNPGCYATGVQLGLAPLVEILAETPHAFGVSGYSGAGTTPSDRNNPEKLRDNLMPYSLVDHTHEREVTRHLGHAVHFLPHVAAYFRGITVTLSTVLTQTLTLNDLKSRYTQRFEREPMIRIVDDPPWVSHAAGRHDVTIGGFSTKERHAVTVVTLDNLLKGAATQAVQNMNLALQWDELIGIPHGQAALG